MHGQTDGLFELDLVVGVQPVYILRRHLQFRDAGVVGAVRQLVPIRLSREADRRGLDPQRQVLGDHNDVRALSTQIERDRQNAGVVVANPES